MICAGKRDCLRGGLTSESRMLWTTDVYVSSFMKPSRGEKPLQALPFVIECNRPSKICCEYRVMQSFRGHIVGWMLSPKTM